MIEIEEVLEATIASGLQERPQVLEDAALGLLVLGRRLDDEVAGAEVLQPVGDANAVEHGAAAGLVDLALGDLARQQPVDRRQRGVEPLLGDVVEPHLVAGLRADEGDAGAHLPGADDADLLDIEVHLARSRTAARPRSADAICRVLANSAASSGSAVIEIGHQTVVGDLEDRRLLVLVDGDDHLRILHTGQMLNGA